jgi:branched-chain amino acid aminotransferase
MHINFNGKIINESKGFISPDNRSFRYGEGLFETIRLQNGKMPLWEKHWKRLNTSFPLLYFQVPKHFNSETLHEEVLKLAAKNNCSSAARIRITFFKGEGGLWEQPSSLFNYIIQCWPAEQKLSAMNENGLDAGIFDSGRKVCDSLANLKSNNYLLYAVAAQYARQQKWNECIVLNQHERICDSTIANVFYVKDGIIYTPALGEGCVDGVMRSFLLENFSKQQISFSEPACTVEDLLQADEIFFTNAFYGIRWVKQLGGKSFQCKQSTLMFHELVAPLFL